MLKRIGNGANWQGITLEEVYSPVAVEVHAASDLHWIQTPDETLQEYIQNFTGLTEKAMGIDPANYVIM